MARTFAETDLGLSWTTRHVAVGVLLGTLFLSAVLHTRHFDGDGLRWLLHIRLEQPSSGGISHALFPSAVWAWSRVGSFFAIPALLERFGVEFPVAVWLQWMNAFGAALGASAFYVALRLSAIPQRAALLTVPLLVASNAFLRAGTDMIEPMWALALALCAVATSLAWGRRLGGAVFAGCLLGLSGCIYQLSLVLGFLVAGALMGEGRLDRHKFVRVLLAAGAAVGCFVLGVLVTLRLFADDGERSLVDTASGLFGRVEPRHLVGALFGLVNTFSPLSNWRGVSGLFHGPFRAAAVNLPLTILAWVTLVTILGVRRARESHRYWIRRAAIFNLVTVWAFAAFWEAAYIKIWLFAAPAIFILFAEVVLERRRAIWAVVPALLLSGFSLGQGIWRAWNDPQDLTAARHLAAVVGGSDLLIAPGWDGPSVYLGTLLRPEQRRWSLTDTAIACRLDEACVRTRISAAVRDASIPGGRIFVFGLLDLSAAEWEVFYGARLGLPRTVLDPLRAMSQATSPVSGTNATLTLLGSPRL